MSIVQGTGIVGTQSTPQTAPDADFSVENFANYAEMMASSPVVGDIGRDTRTGRLFKYTNVGAHKWWLPFELVPDGDLDYVKDGSGNDSAILYQEAAPAHVTLVNASKSSNANLVIDASFGTSYAFTSLPEPTGSVKRLLVLFPASITNTSYTTYISGKAGVFPRLLVGTSSAKISSVTSALSSGENTPSITEPIFMYSDTSVAEGSTIVFCASTLMGQEAVIKRPSLELQGSYYFGVTNFDRSNTIVIKHLFCVELGD